MSRVTLWEDNRTGLELFMDSFMKFTFGAERAGRIAQHAEAGGSGKLVGGFKVVSGDLSKTLGSGNLQGYTLIAKGTGLSVDGSGRPNGGTISRFEIRNANDRIVADVELQIPFLATDWVAAAEAGSGAVNQYNYSEMYDLIIPSFVTITGAAGTQHFTGNKQADFFYGKGGADVFVLFQGDDLMDGGKGSDTVDASILRVAINANLTKKFVKYGSDEATLNSIENVDGSRKSDTIVGNRAKNELDGGKGKDNIKGQGGNDLIKGGKGNDVLNGGKGKDKFLFHKKDGTDKILKFQDGQDKLVLKGFGFKNKKQALKKFYEIGGKNDDKVGFDDKGTKIIIKGADLKDIDGSDILI